MRRCEKTFVIPKLRVKFIYRAASAIANDVIRSKVKWLVEAKSIYEFEILDSAG